MPNLQNLVCKGVVDSQNLEKVVWGGGGVGVGVGGRLRVQRKAKQYSGRALGWDGHETHGWGR